MDTPERSRFGGTPISKFEDSPVFNFINNLSPIQPVKSVHSIHTFHSPGSATIASVFSSPHVSSHKESRFFIRNPFPDSVKPGTSSDLLDENDIPPVSDEAVLSTSSVLAQESSNMTCHLNRAAVDPADENSTQPNYSEPFKFDNGSPEHNTTPLYANKLDFKLHISCTPSEHVQLVQDVSEGAHKTLSPDFGLEMEFSADQVKEDASESNWKNLITDNDDGLLRVEPTSGLGTVKTKEQENEFSMSARPKASFDIYVHNDSRDSLVVDDGTSELHTLNLLPDTCQEQEILEEGYLNTEAEIDDGSSLGCKLNSQQHRGVRRRCLVFEVAAVSKKNLHNDSNAAPTIISPTNAKSISVNEQLLSPKNLKSPKSYVLPGIGLHLNALARTSKDSPIPQKTKVPGRDFVCRPCSVRPYVPLIPGENQPEKALERKDASGSEVSDNQIVSFDATLTPTMGIEESASPKKKRRRVENSGENDNCRRCNCKKSKCLKLYCECFAAGVYCVEPCSCQGCLNKPVHEETVLATRKQIESRNPLAFAPKVIRTSERDQEIGEESNKTPASARHKRGCNCKKSNCLKKYCECYQGGVGCSFSCRCEGCKNAFGRKDGSEETEYEEELDTCEKESIKPDNDKAIAIVPKTDQIQLSESPLPITPFGACSAVKTASPNGKRVSLPLNGFGMSPNFKGGRKLILKSIPSFPSLSCETHSSAQLNSSTSA